MSKYKVKVKVIAEAEYEVEIDSSNFTQAEDAAAAMWREKTPEDFQVDKGYITNWEIDSEQTSWECEGCSKPITEEKYYADGICAECVKQHEEAA